MGSNRISIILIRWELLKGYFPLTKKEKRLSNRFESIKIIADQIKKMASIVNPNVALNKGWVY